MTVAVMLQWRAPGLTSLHVHVCWSDADGFQSFKCACTRAQWRSPRTLSMGPLSVCTTNFPLPNPTKYSFCTCGQIQTWRQRHRKFCSSRLPQRGTVVHERWGSAKAVVRSVSSAMSLVQPSVVYEAQLWQIVDDDRGTEGKCSLRVRVKYQSHSSIFEDHSHRGVHFPAAGRGFACNHVNLCEMWRVLSAMAHRCA